MARAAASLLGLLLAVALVAVAPPGVAATGPPSSAQGVLVALEMMAGRVAYDQPPDSGKQPRRILAKKWRVANAEEGRCWRLCDLRFFGDSSCGNEVRGWTSTIESGHDDQDAGANALRDAGAPCGIDGGNWTAQEGQQPPMWSPANCSNDDTKVKLGQAWLGVEFANATEIRCVKMAQHPHEDAQIDAVSVQYFDAELDMWRTAFDGTALRNNGTYARVSNNPAAPAQGPPPCNETLEKTLQGTLGCPDGGTHRYQNTSNQMVYDTSKKRYEEGKGIEPAKGDETEEEAAKKMGQYFYKTDPDEIKETIEKVEAADAEVEKSLNAAPPAPPQKLVHAPCPTHSVVKPFLHFPPSNKSSERRVMALIRTVAGCGGNVTADVAAKVANRTEIVMELVRVVGGHNKSHGDLSPAAQSRVNNVTMMLTNNGTMNKTTLEVKELVSLLSFRPAASGIRTALDALVANKNETNGKSNQLRLVMKQVMDRRGKKMDRKKFELTLHEHVDKFFNKTAKLHPNDTTLEERQRETRARKSAHKLIRDMRSDSKANKTAVVRTALKKWANSPAMVHNDSSKAKLISALTHFVDRRNGTRQVGTGPSTLDNFNHLESVLNNALAGLKGETNTSLDKVSADLRGMLMEERARVAAETAIAEKNAVSSAKNQSNATLVVSRTGKPQRSNATKSKGNSSSNASKGAAGNASASNSSLSDGNASHENVTRTANTSDASTPTEADMVKGMIPSELVSAVATNVDGNQTNNITSPGVKAAAVNRLSVHLIDIGGPADNQSDALKELIDLANNKSFDLDNPSAAFNRTVDAISATGDNGEPPALPGNMSTDIMSNESNITVVNSTMDDEDDDINGTDANCTGVANCTSGNGTNNTANGSRGANSTRLGNGTRNGNGTRTKTKSLKKPKEKQEEAVSTGGIWHYSYHKRNALIPVRPKKAAGGNGSNESLAGPEDDGIYLDNFNDIEVPVPEFPHQTNVSNQILIKEHITETESKSTMHTFCAAQAAGMPLEGTQILLILQQKANECPDNNTELCGTLNENCTQCLKFIAKLEADGKRVIDTKGTAMHTLAKLEKEGVTPDQILLLLDVLNRSPNANFDAEKLANAPDFEHELGEILYPSPLLPDKKNLTDREQALIQNMTGGVLRNVSTFNKNVTEVGGNVSAGEMEQPDMPRCSQRKSCKECNADRMCGWCETTKRSYEFIFQIQAINEVPVTTGECMRMDPATEKPATKKCEGFQSVWKPEYCMRANCSAAKTCGECAQDKRCGWCNSADPEKRGCFDALPWGSYTRVRKSWKRQMEMGQWGETGSKKCPRSDWNYGTCINANCTARSGCSSCVKDVRCGFCLNTCMRYEEAANTDICRAQDFEWNGCPIHGNLDNWRNQDWHPMNSLSYADKNKNAFDQFKPSFICSALTQEGPRNCVNNTLCGWSADGATGVCMAGDKDGPDTGSSNRWFYGETPDDFCGRYKNNCSLCLADSLCSFCISGPQNTGSCLSVGNNDGSGPDACLDWRHSVSTEPEDLNETCSRPLPVPPVANVTVNTTANFTVHRSNASNTSAVSNASNISNVTVTKNVTIFNATNVSRNASGFSPKASKPIFYKQHTGTKQVTVDDLLVSDRPHVLPGQLKPRNSSNDTNQTLLGNISLFGK